ncbi:hypothetical protein QOZ80_5AG0397350 [Eleusine coracana subsp. coracana]|nr:hypothetical protein QOZ80_5AG0397350 [Eleusine coracana subsp. coracana]
MPLSLLKSITNNFSNDRQIGVGGFAVVYKGQLRNGAVAVKKLTQTLDVHETKFHQEVDSLLRVKHKNIVRFLGYCSDTQGKVWKLGGKNVMADERQRFLCFEFLPEGSLDNYISNASQGLEWMTRFHIIKGVCEGLHYLHQQKIVHLDLKPANILLDRYKVPKIADFGLSKCFDEKQTRAMTSNMFGSLGYMAPECYDGLITFKSDIYSLGIVIIEILTGQKGYPEIENVLGSWTARFGTSQGDMRLEPVRICAEIGIECTDFNPAKRPVTQHIIQRLAEVECTYGLIKSDLFISPSESNGSDEVKLEEGGNNLFDDDEPWMEDEFEKWREPKRFSYSELAAATNNFSEERVSKGSKQGRKEYASQVRLMSRLRHCNLVQFIGCCESSSDLLLVYELMPNNSLNAHLVQFIGYGGKSQLTWQQRHEIVLGIASAILYLHEEWEQCVLHTDIKPSNVLLDAFFNAKLGGFGLARLVDHGRESYSTETELRDTVGYLDPQCYVNRGFSTESDVYSFGVVLLEIASGRQPMVTVGKHLVEWVWEAYGRGTVSDDESLKAWPYSFVSQRSSSRGVLDAADGRLNGEFDVREMETVLIVGLWCAHPKRSMRPSKYCGRKRRCQASLHGCPWRPDLMMLSITHIFSCY